MKTFTHNNVNDTTLERDGNTITLYFVNDPFTMETEIHEFPYEQDELFEKLGDYFDHCLYTDIFDELTMPAQDALWNALLWLNQNNEEV